MKLLLTFLSFLILIIIIPVSNCQEIDSLLNQISIAEQKNETETQIELYKKTGNFYYEKRDYANALDFFSKALNKSRKNEDKLYFYKTIGNVFVDSTNYTLALEYLTKALEINGECKKTDEYPQIYNLIGMSYGLTNNLDEAIESFEKALEYNIELNDSSQIGLSYYNIGLANYLKGSYDRAIENFVISANIRKNLADTTALVASLTSIGEIFRIKKEYTKSTIYYETAINYKKGIKSKETLAYLYSEMALLSKNRKKHEDAFAYIDTAMGYCEEIGYKRGMATLISYKAGIEKTLGNIDMALSLYKQTIPGYEEIGFQQGVIQSNIFIAEILTEKNKPTEALSILNKTEIQAKANNLLDEQTNISKLKYESLKKLGQNAMALKEVDRYMILNDSLLNIQKEEKINEIETKYQTEEKEKQIEFLDKENKIIQHQMQMRNYLLISAAVVFVLAILIFILFYRQNKLKSQLKIEQGSQRLLRSQMNPHFIYNALAAIQNYILQNNPIDSATYIAEFSRLMRLVLEGSRSDFVSLKDDIELAENYLKLQRLRFDNAFEFSVEVDKKIPVEEIKIPPILSQPFIENAVEHGMRNLPSGEGSIKILYKEEKPHLTISIIDNGPGIEKTNNSTKKNHKSLATKITQERIENIKRTQKINIDFKIESNSGIGTKVIFSLPYDQNEK